VDGTVLANVALDATGKATLTTSGLLPGAHTVVATYAGDPNYLPSTATLTQNVGCDRVFTNGTLRRATVLGPGSSCFVNETINGAVIRTRPGAAIFISNSTIRGSIYAAGTTFFAMCATTVLGGVNVNSAVGFVVIGDPFDDGCSGNSIRGVALSGDIGGVEVIGNVIGGTLLLRGDSGVGPMPDDVGPEIEANAVGRISCSRNTPAPTNDGRPNLAIVRVGQCVGI
jgi:hypothetical protein